MLFDKRLTIRAKTILIAMVCTTSALLVSVIFSEFYEERRGRKHMEEELTAISTIVAGRSKAAIQFLDTELATENLAALSAIEAIEKGCLFDAEQALFAEYYRGGNGVARCPDKLGQKKALVAEQMMHVYHPVMLDGSVIGHLYVAASLQQFKRLLVIFFFVNVAFAVVAVLIAFIMANRMQRLITQPINNLIRAAADVEASQNYSLRAAKTSDDEIGDLANAFNQMLDRIEAENQLLRTSEERFRTLTSASPFGVFQVDKDGYYVYVNQCWHDITGIQEETISDQSFFRALHPEDRHQTFKKWRYALKSHQDFRAEFRLLHENGDEVNVICQAKPVYNHDGAFYGYLGSMADVSELKTMQLKMEKLALYDPLTELPNRRLFRNRLDKAIVVAQRTRKKLAVMFLDFDHFKKVNDSLGHDQGDELLVEMAKRFRFCTRQSDTVSRLGGDEFTLLVPEIAHRHEVDLLAKKLINTLRRPINLKGQQLSVTCSIGIALFPDDAADANTLMKNADLAMYRSKDQGRNLFSYFSEEMNLAITQQIRIENDLRHAIDNEELVLYFQPKINLHSELLVGYEALLRWQHPTDGLVSPGEFIPVAEDTGLITQIGQWVLESVCQKIPVFLEQGKMTPDCQVAVNLSAKQFHNPRLVKNIGDTLARYNINPGLIELEITESLLMTDIDSAIEKLKALRALGITLSIDDFGTGYSSFNYLKRLPIDIIKIDRSFVADIPSDKDDMEIVSAIIAMAHKLRLKVIAEGLETDEQKVFLYQNECDMAQGFLIGRPCPPDKLANPVTSIKSRRSN